MPDKAKIETELDLLTALEGGDVVTQSALSKRLSVSIGLVNALLKRVIRKGFVKAKAAPYKRWKYYLTPAGFSEKSRLVTEYLQISLSFYRTVRRDYSALFSRVRACGYGQVILIGRGELAEIALLTAQEENIEIVGLLDDDANDDLFHGIPLFRCLDGNDSSAALVITDSLRPDHTFGLSVALSGERPVFVPSFLRISTTDANLPSA